MSTTRVNRSNVWKYFTKQSGPDWRAICSVCKESLSYRTSTGNLNAHIKKRHPGTYLKYKEGSKSSNPRKDADEDSNFSVKFSSEIWEHFEQEGALSRCGVCAMTTETTVEDMKTHLEEHHPGILIGIMKNKSADQADDELVDEELVHEEAVDEDTFTEVVYLEEEPKRKHKNPLKRSRNSRLNVESTIQEKPRIEYKIVPHTVTTDSRPEIDSFLSYLGVLLKDTAKESFPKLQLDIISLVLNAQMANNQAVPLIPSTAVITVPNDTANTTNCPVRVKNSIGDYRITIENKDDSFS